MAIKDTTLLNSNKITAVDPEGREAAVARDSGITANLGKTTAVKDTSVFDKAIEQKVSTSKTGVPQPQQRSGGSGTTGAQPANAYSDIAGNKEGYTPNSEGLGNTGAGAEAALGTDYTWNQQGSTEAQKKYESDVLEQKQALLNNRQTMETNAVNYQTQADMLKYQNNQNAEKVGWTGGYVLDQNRQMDYLKASIQAQMYGAMELQKYGYDSSLAAARLSYDLNQQEYARQYYEQAVSTALSEAQLTGTYFSAETKDMMSQLAVARQKADDASLSTEEREQASKLIGTIESWFQENGISKEGVKTLEAWTQDQSNELNWSNELWTRYQAAIEAANTNISDNPSTFIMIDAEGKEIWDGVNVTTGNWDTMTGENIISYIKDNQMAANQYYAYLDSTLTGTVETGFAKWCQTKGYISTDENGNQTIKGGQNFKNLLNKYIGSSGIVDQFTKKFEGLNENEVYKMLSEWDFTIQLPDGTTVSKTYAQLSQEAEDTNSSPNGPQTFEGENESGEQVKYTWENTTTGTTQTAGYNGSNYYKTTLTQGNNSGKKISVTTAMVTGVDSPNHGSEDNLDSDDIGIKIYENDSGDIKGGYDTEVDDTTHSIIWKPGTAEGDEISAYIENCTGSKPQSGQVIVVAGTAYFYNQAGTGPYSKLGSGWIKIGGQCGKSTFKSGLGAQWVD